MKAIKGGFDRNWTLLGAGDCTGDGKDDLVFSHTETGSVIMYPASTTSKILGQLDGHHLI